jgi:hypothetical protein
MSKKVQIILTTQYLFKKQSTNLGYVYGSVEQVPHGKCTGPILQEKFHYSACFSVQNKNYKYDAFELAIRAAYMSKFFSDVLYILVE